MKISAEIFSFIAKSFKSFWAQYPSTVQNGKVEKCRFSNDLPEVDRYTDDQDMERLVRVIEETRDINSLRY